MAPSTRSSSQSGGASEVVGWSGWPVVPLSPSCVGSVVFLEPVELVPSVWVRRHGNDPIRGYVRARQACGSIALRYPG